MEPLTLKTLRDRWDIPKRRSKISNFKCEHCGKEFVKEKTLMVHMCEPKRRYMQRDEKRVQNGFYVYNRFYKITQNAKKEKTYEEFVKSPYYNAFVKFGSFMSNVNPLYPDKYIDWIIRSDVALDKWCREELYDKFVVDLIRTERVETACERSINTMVAWGEKHSAGWNHYFNYANVNKIIYDIRDGKVSPWVMLNSENGIRALQNMNDEQLQIIAPMVDIEFWSEHFRKNKSDMEFAKNLIKEAKI